jgi:hypothetical protein
MVNMALGAQSCSGATDGSGVAQCNIVVNGALGASTPITADFAGDTFYRPSSASATAIVFAFPTGGAFALGDSSASSPGTKTFWAAGWANINVLTGGDAPSAFKGFTNNVSLPTSNPPASCGGPWTTSGGNSPPPPATVPSYMGVLVSSNVSKGGPTISGNTVQIVVVKVNPGYGPNPGSAGTGTVVGVFCP